MATVPSTKPVKKGQLVQATLLSLFPKKPHQKADLSDVTGAAVSSSLEGAKDFVARAVGGAVETGTAQAVKTEERAKTRVDLGKYGKSVSSKEKATAKRRQVAAGHCARKRSCHGGRYVLDEVETECGSDVDESEGESDDSYESSFIDDSDDDGSDDDDDGSDDGSEEGEGDCDDAGEGDDGHCASNSPRIASDEDASAEDAIDEDASGGGGEDSEPED